MITMVNPLSGLHSIRVIELVFCNGVFCARYTGSIMHVDGLYN